MKGYLKNNIGFRRFTAERFADMYKAKAFMLGEILDSNKHEFTPQARETLLQYLSSATDWLMLIERVYIRAGHGVSTRAEIEQVIETFAAMERTVHEILLNNPEDFSPEFSSTWIDMREQTMPSMSMLLNHQLSDDMFESFQNIVDFTIGYMNSTLFNLHEVDYLIVRRSSPFIYADKIDLAAMEVCGKSMPTLRLSVYGQHRLLEPYGEDVHLRAKLTIDDKFINGTESRISAYRDLRASLSQCDIRYF
ncbi:hypothetical protein pEaSNUABM5_00096 [Erwinia phage pEa_SNUABM_5]|uniref:Uncharacterized protein n=1 Tax=Erwinia phage pEa_SNUABM_5 TaxID=2797313 RepID=A0A7T8EPE6_9CAUD|nr:hypothetical protein MPK73_gp096 [Erwinia phage pEa_SNUABM_5]QQO90238.1 hypothetical protein pEaSNUABM5_00096 [Erwinia phage pEa_SNUABM_5]